MISSEVVPCLVCDDYMKSKQCCKEWNSADRYKNKRLPIRIVPDPCPVLGADDAVSKEADSVRRYFDDSNPLLNPSLELTAPEASPEFDLQVDRIAQHIVSILKRDPQRKHLIETGTGGLTFAEHRPSNTIETSFSTNDG